MSIRNTLSRLGSNLVATSALLLAVSSPALAAGDAVVRLLHTAAFGPGVLMLTTANGNATSGPFTTYTGVTAVATFAQGTGTVQVGTGTMPSVMFAKSALLKSTLSSITFSIPPYTPSGTLVFQSKFNIAGTLETSHARAVNGTTVIVPVNATTICHQEYTLTPNGSAAPDLAGECFPRSGSLTMEEGPSRYGGSLRLLGIIVSQGKRVSSPFDIYFYYTAMRTGPGTLPPYAGGYHRYGVGTFVTTNAGSALYFQGQSTEGPYTTGMARVYKPGGGYFTSINRTGSFALNGTANTGVISLVRPSMNTQFNRAGGVIVSTGPNFGLLWTTTLTFLPEPGYLALLGFGLLGLVGIQTARKR